MYVPVVSKVYRLEFSSVCICGMMVYVVKKHNEIVVSENSEKNLKILSRR